MGSLSIATASRAELSQTCSGRRQDYPRGPAWQVIPRRPRPSRWGRPRAFPSRAGAGRSPAESIFQEPQEDFNIRGRNVLTIYLLGKPKMALPVDVLNSPQALTGLDTSLHFALFGSSP